MQASLTYISRSGSVKGVNTFWIQAYFVKYIREKTCLE